MFWACDRPAGRRWGWRCCIGLLTALFRKSVVAVSPLWGRGRRAAARFEVLWHRRDLVLAVGSQFPYNPAGCGWLR